MTKQLAVVSGKGGTGKTTVTAALARLWEEKVVVDCDVDAANLHLVLQPRIQKSYDFWSGKKAILNLELCTVCGQCREVCRSEAINREYRIDKLACIGCGSCVLVCPQEAINLRDNLSGEWYLSESPFGPMVHARLGIAEDNSGKLVSQIRDQAKELAQEHGLSTVLIDGPPGIGCPVIASITGVDLILIVTEPTLSGLHDLERIARLAANFKIPAVVCINKFNLNPEQTEHLISACQSQGLEVIGQIPFSRGVVQSMVDASDKNMDFFMGLPENVKNELHKIKKRLEGLMAKER